jgi:VanZ family protein
MRTAPTLSTSRLKNWLLGCPLRVRRGACVLHLLLIAVLSLLPSWLFPPSVTQIPGIDKWVHVAMYGLLGALLRWATGQGGRASPSSWWLPAAAAGYGLLMEFLQLQLSGGTRMFSWADAAANLVGVVVFWLAVDRIMPETVV